MLLMASLELTDQCGVQEQGDVEDFVQTHGCVDAFVLLASAEKDTQTDTNTERREQKKST